MGVKTRKLGNISDSLIQWQAVVVADGSTGLAAVAGRGYFINTTAGAITVTLPGSPVIGDTITIVDYASTFATNNVTVDPGSNKIEGSTVDGTLNTNDQTHTIVFTDSTQGWKIVNQDTASGIQAAYISATGGTVSTSGNFKIHSFTGDGNFVVAAVGNASGGGDYASKVDYLVLAGGGAGGNGGCGDNGGGGGAGGFREGRVSSPAYTASPLVAPDGLTVAAQTYPITVGGGGSTTPKQGGAGSNSVFSTITSAGGGGGAANQQSDGYNSPDNGKGGSGGGGRGGGGVTPADLLLGNTPPTSPSQGNPGGLGGAGGGANPQSPDHGAGGGGGAGQAGQNAGNVVGGVGGNGAPTHISGSDVTRAGGGGGGAGPSMTAGGAGGSGGGGAGAKAGATTVAGTANTGSGGGGGNPGGSPLGSAAGGKGLVIIRYKYQN